MHGIPKGATTIDKLLNLRNHLGVDHGFISTNQDHLDDLAALHSALHHKSYEGGGMHVHSEDDFEFIPALKEGGE